MTREEAIEKVRAVEKHTSIAQFYVDAQVALGMLKLDEPKSAWAKFAQVLVDDFGYSAAEHCSSTTLHSINEALTRAGLKIVEK